MADYKALKSRGEQLAARDWNMPALEARIKKLVDEGIPRKTLARNEILANRQIIQDRVQRRAEEDYCILKNCTQGTALALMEEFGLGNMDIIKALTPFPGIGGTGQTCGGISGSLIAIGLYFGGNDRLDVEATGATIMNAQKFMAAFEDEMGHRLCAEIHEHVLFGRNMDPGASENHMAAFAQAKGFEKCSLATGTGARLTAECIIDSMA